MTMSRRQHSGEFKAKVVLESAPWERTIHELAAEYGVHPCRSPSGSEWPWKSY
jgi:transposase-like protein